MKFSANMIKIARDAHVQRKMQNATKPVDLSMRAMEINTIYRMNCSEGVPLTYFEGITSGYWAYFTLDSDLNSAGQLSRR